MIFHLSRHAEGELVLRSIPRHLLDDVLHRPQHIVPEYAGRKAYQSKLDFGHGRMSLLRAIVDDRVDPAVVVTVYRTSRIDKYWR